MQMIRENESIEFNIKLSKKQPEAKLTDVEAQNIDQEIVRNIVMYGQPLGLQIPPQSRKGSQQIWMEK